MSKNAAPEEKLGILHSITAQVLIEQLKGQPEFDDDGVEIGRFVDPRFVSSAITFLNNNKITANPFLDEALSELEERLKNKTTRFKVVGSEAADRAAANI